MTAPINSLDTDLIYRLKKVAPFIGNTPLFPIKNIFHNPDVQLFAKLEWQQLSGSVKARAGFQIIKDAIEKGELYYGKRLLDASSGNTAIAYATIGASIGISVTICMPDNSSAERQQILRALGVELILTPGADGADGAQLKAKSLLKENPSKFFYANQYANENNWKAHYYNTGEEIWKQTNGEITHFVVGLGTSGTFMGTGRKLKEKNKNIQLVSLQPEVSKHGLEGWKHMDTAIFVPTIYNNELADRTVRVSASAAHDLVRMVAEKEGLLIGPSSAANLAGAIRVAEQLEKGIVVTTFADNAQKYSEIMKEIFKK